MNNILGPLILVVRSQPRGGNFAPILLLPWVGTRTDVVAGRAVIQGGASDVAAVRDRLAIVGVGGITSCRSVPGPGILLNRFRLGSVTPWRFPVRLSREL